MKLPGSMCDEHFKKVDIDVKRWVIAILMELETAEQKHPKWPTDPNFLDIPDFVHASAIVSEESGELTKAALQYTYENGRYYDMHKEAVQVGAMALRFLKNAPEKPFVLPTVEEFDRGIKKSKQS